ncbi:hypothetical protein BDN72DRAFT_929015 [Pluteus cervinus]|uniref:Uncharacterized protein n=1 Tax=Pluteus cervinus TaxID=181527 RepID=A0ACD3ABR4_9AGAR|nr:hypothetical protein BDN72DRAFT_929015 [Pluteus cervinus]
MHQSTYLLLVQEGKRGQSNDPEPQLIAEAIAAFAHNRRIQAPSPLDRQVITAIAMVGISPVFDRFTVTLDLLQAVGIGSYPTQPTVVLKEWDQWQTVAPSFSVSRH